MSSNHNIDRALEAKRFLENFLENAPPYKSVKITPFLPEFVGLIEVAVQLFCDVCGGERTFTYRRNTSQTNSMFPELSHQLMKQAPQPPSSGEFQQKVVVIKHDSPACFSDLKLSCAKCGNRVFFGLMVKGSEITKTGQYPMFTDLRTRGFVKYKSLKMIKKHYPELEKSVKCISQKMGIGAFAYLRRIYESFIDAKYKALPEESKIPTKDSKDTLADKLKAIEATKTTIPPELGSLIEPMYQALLEENKIPTKDNKDARHSFADKLKAVEAVEAVIPPELDSVKKSLYSVLSKGLHEYDEAECLELYDAVLLAVEHILQIELNKKERRVRAKEAVAKIGDKFKEGSPNEQTQI
jgi:hypothetical protein